MLTQTIENSSGVPWSGFLSTLTDRDQFDFDGVLVDGVVPEGDGTLAHPSKSHFHTGSGDFAVLGNDKPLDILNRAEAQAGTGMEFGGGVLETAHAFSFEVRIHDILVGAVRRRFDLVQQPIPVPEPGTLVIVGGGVAVLLICGLKRWMRSRN